VSARGALRRISESLDYLSQIVAAQSGAAQPDFDRVLSAYIESRRELAESFRDLAGAMLMHASDRIERVRAEIKATMQREFGGLVPERLVEVRAYASVHALLLEYLAAHVGEPVSASRLRILAGDQVHTERRVRELRDLGFAIAWKRGAGEIQYVLESDQPDLADAARSQLALGLRADKELGREARASLLEYTSR
jgi:hypothetical protein